MCEVLGATLFFASLMFILFGVVLVTGKIILLACDFVGYCTISTWRFITGKKELK